MVHHKKHHTNVVKKPHNFDRFKRESLSRLAKLHPVLCCTVSTATDPFLLGFLTPQSPYIYPSSFSLIPVQHARNPRLQKRRHRHLDAWGEDSPGAQVDFYLVPTRGGKSARCREENRGSWTEALCDVNNSERSVDLTNCFQNVRSLFSRVLIKIAGIAPAKLLPLF